MIHANLWRLVGEFPPIQAHLVHKFNPFRLILVKAAWDSYAEITVVSHFVGRKSTISSRSKKFGFVSIFNFICFFLLVGHCTAYQINGFRRIYRQKTEKKNIWNSIEFTKRFLNHLLCPKFLLCKQKRNAEEKTETNWMLHSLLLQTNSFANFFIFSNLQLDGYLCSAFASLAVG